MTNSAKYLRLALTATLAFFCPKVSPAQVTPINLADGIKAMDSLTGATSLDQAGLKPWHLKISFQLYDLDGKPREKGTAEEWWFSPGRGKLVIESPSFQQTLGGQQTSGGPADALIPHYGRNGFLVHELLDAVARPVTNFGSFDGLQIAEVPRTIGDVFLRCLVVGLQSQPSIPSPSDPSTYFCTNPNTNTLRVSLGQDRPTIVRNRIGKFQNINVGLDELISYNSKAAISGHVDLLETFDAPGSALEPGALHPNRFVPAILTAGHALSSKRPTYPETARQQHISGTVVLLGIISPQGDITSLDVIASPAPMLSVASLDAVKQWKYRPFTFDGKATEIDTQITVNFSFTR